MQCATIAEFHTTFNFLNNLMENVPEKVLKTFCQKCYNFVLLIENGRE